MELARQSTMDAFDRDHPLWEFTLVEGIRGGRAALVFKVHHSLSDGVGGMRMLGVLFDLQREPADQGEMPPAPAGETLGLRAFLGDAVGSVAGSTARLARQGGAAAIPALMHCARDPVGMVRDAAMMARSVYRTAAPILDTESPLMRARGMTRHLATMEVPLPP